MDTQFTSTQTKKIQKWYKKLDAVPYRDSIMRYYAIDSAALENYLSTEGDHSMASSAKIAHTILKSRCFDWLSMLTMMRRERKTEKVGGNLVRSYDVIDSELPNDYYDILRDIDVSDTTTLILSNFGIFANRYEFASFFSFFTSQLNTLDTYVDLITTKKIEASESVIETARAIGTNTKNKREDIKIGPDEHKEFIQFINEYYPLIANLHCEAMVYKPERAVINEKIAKGQELWGDDADLLTQIVIARRFSNISEQLSKQNAQQYKELLFEYITDPYIRQIINTKFDARFSVATDSHRPIPEGAGKPIIEKLLKPHKGKYVMVDFWASGCGPCVYGIEHSHDVRQKLADEPIVFMFITDTFSTSQKLYDKYMTPTIGDKHRISRDDWNKIASLFDVNSIPRYMLFDKEGQIIDDHFGGWHDIERKLKEL